MSKSLSYMHMMNHELNEQYKRKNKNATNWENEVIIVEGLELFRK